MFFHMVNNWLSKLYLCTSTWCQLSNKLALANQEFVYTVLKLVSVNFILLPVVVCCAVSLLCLEATLISKIRPGNPTFKSPLQILWCIPFMWHGSSPATYFGSMICLMTILYDLTSAWALLGLAAIHARALCCVNGNLSNPGWGNGIVLVSI